MSDARIRLQLAQGVLLGEKDAHRVLADLYEDRGDIAMADWSRVKKRGVNGRLDFVLAVLPFRFTLFLACDSLAAASSQYDIANTIIPTLKRIRDWTVITETDTNVLDPNYDLVGALRRTAYIPVDEEIDKDDAAFEAKQCLEYFENAVRWAIQTVKFERDSNFRGQRNGKQETVNQIRRMRRLYPGYVNSVIQFGQNLSKSDTEKWWVLGDLNEADYSPGLMEFHHWEIQHTQRWITKMLESKELSRSEIH